MLIRNLCNVRLTKGANRNIETKIEKKSTKLLDGETLLRIVRKHYGQRIIITVNTKQNYRKH